MSKPKLILLNGFAGSGKTTIAKMYANDHPLSLVIEGDELIVNIGSWLEHETEARSLVFALTKSMLTTALKAGHDVVLPYLVTRAEEAGEIEQVSRDCHANFYEIYLAADEAYAVERLLKRGTWGEAGTTPLTQKDKPIIKKLYERMNRAVQKRPGSIHIYIKEGDPKSTYRELLKYI